MFRQSCEFYYEHGREIVDAFLRLAIFANKNNLEMKDVDPLDFQRVVGKGVLSLGVRYYSLLNRQRLQQTKLSKADYFTAFRNNQGLYELLAVYFGATQLVVGALLARRIGEINDLETGMFSDSTEAWIVFKNRKSSEGLMGLRSLEARPVEKVAVDMLKELQRLHRILNRIGFGPQCNQLFRRPMVRKSERNTNDFIRFNENFDFLCDYFETDVNCENKRYYVRQHQLRRFFAILFFYSRSFGGLETLQWMLGHTDVSHVWHYITESVGGDVLRGAKSQYIAESLHREGSEGYKELATLVKSRYGTDDFQLIDTEELEDYLSDLLEEGHIEVEPEFFHCPDGEDFRVVVKVKDSSRSQNEKR